MGDQRYEKQWAVEATTPTVTREQVERARRVLAAQPDGDLLSRMLGLEQ